MLGSKNLRATLGDKQRGLGACECSRVTAGQGGQGERRALASASARIAPITTFRHHKPSVHPPKPRNPNLSPHILSLRATGHHCIVAIPDLGMSYIHTYRKTEFQNSLVHPSSHNFPPFSCCSDLSFSFNLVHFLSNTQIW